MKDDIVICLNVLEVDLLINMLDEIVSEHKIPESINEEIRQELFSELDIAKILTDLKMKIGNEKFEQLQELTEEEQNEVRTFAIKFSESEIDYLRNGDYSEIETVIEEILTQIKEQEA